MSRDTWLLDQLPVGMVSDEFFARFVSIFQAEAGTLLAHGDNLPHLADPTVAPPAMVRWLADWIGLDGIDPDLPVLTQRRLVSTAARTLRRRGTPDALQQFLELFQREAAQSCPQLGQGQLVVVLQPDRTVRGFGDGHRRLGVAVELTLDVLLRERPLLLLPGIPCARGRLAEVRNA